MTFRLPFLCRVLILLASLGLWGGSLLAQTLVPTGATWQWRPGSTEASSPVGAWRDPSFQLTDFTPAPAPFWYGDPLEGGTQIQGMQGVYGCVFLRRTFTVSDPSTISKLRLGALVDDGFVAWINGTEVLRVGMPGEAGSEVTIGLLANNAVEPVAFNLYELPSPATYLRTGENVLAVQVFQSNVASSDLGFEASLDATARETVPPSVSRLEPAHEAVVSQLTAFSITFSEPVTGVVAAHLLVNGIGASDVTTTDGLTHTYLFPQPAYGAVNLRFALNQTITDRAEPPNPLDAVSASAQWRVQLVDRTSPTLLGTTPLPGSTVRSLTEISVLFSEAVVGVEAADLLVNGQAAAEVSRVGASQYLFTFPEPAAGMVTVAWAGAQGITDTATPPNPFAGGSWTYRLDPNAPEAAPYVSEFMASNTRTLRDEDGEYPDWIEIYNPSPIALNLEGWALTDSTNNLGKWRFPATNLAGGRFLVVFASGKDRRVPGAPLHTDFNLAAGGEYLALVRPDRSTVVSEFAPAYPRQMPDVSHGTAQILRGDFVDAGPSGVYFTAPSPGTANLGGTSLPGPVISQFQHTPNVPTEDQDLVITARVSPAFAPVTTVELRYRIQFGAVTTLPMLDDGAHGDGAAGDGVYGATIPAAEASAGQMIRYALLATDTSARTSRWPLFNQPNATPEYLGTIVQPTNVVSQLPIFHLFVAPNQMGAIDSENGGRASFFYDGEFYDNIYVELRGNTSAGLSKKSHRLEFNRGHELRHAGPGGRTRRSSLLAEYLDPAYLRQHLCFWLLNNLGVPAPYHYPVRVQMNGQFYQLAFHSDVIGKEQVERMGYDPRGALYKAVGNLVPWFSSTGVFQKLEPEGDPSRADYLQLAEGIINSAPEQVRRRTVFDLLDLPQVINHLAGARWCAENDDVWANMSLYRDTYGDGLWRNIPFDMNASWGQLYGGSSPLEATSDFSKSHPLYGGSGTESNFNQLYDVIVALPETRQMLLRRQRTLLDRWVQPPSTPVADRILENYIRQMTNLIAPEAALDRSRWGFSPWAPGKTFASGINDLINQFIVPRRRHWYVTHSVTNTARPIGITSASNAGIPLAQPADARVVFGALDFNPASGNQAQEYLTLSNAMPVALDLTDWKIEGAVTFTFQPGTVIPSGGLLYLSPDVRQFRARTTGPRGGQGLFVVGPYSGQLSARGESLVLKAEDGRVVDTLEYPGAPSPAQQYLRVTEIMYHPAPPPGAGATLDADDFEFLELANLSTNLTLDLTGIRFIGGIQFDFTTSPLRQLAPGARVVVVANAVAFASRYGDDIPVAGEYLGQLDNGGERLRLVDARGEEVLDFSYPDEPASTDGRGESLVVVNPNAAPDAWNEAAQWKAGGKNGGTPGSGDDSPEPTPRPRLTVAAIPTGLVLRFEAVAGRSYRVERSENLTPALWLPQETVPAAAATRPVEIPITADSARQFFRVVAP